MSELIRPRVLDATRLPSCSSPRGSRTCGGARRAPRPSRPSSWTIPVWWSWAMSVTSAMYSVSGFPELEQLTCASSLRVGRPANPRSSPLERRARRRGPRSPRDGTGFCTLSPDQTPANKHGLRRTGHRSRLIFTKSSYRISMS